jgi:hypothetical protein
MASLIRANIITSYKPTSKLYIEVEKSEKEREDR